MENVLIAKEHFHSVEESGFTTHRKQNNNSLLCIIAKLMVMLLRASVALTTMTLVMLNTHLFNSKAKFDSKINATSHTHKQNIIIAIIIIIVRLKLCNKIDINSYMIFNLHQLTFIVYVFNLKQRNWSVSNDFEYLQWNLQHISHISIDTQSKWNHSAFSSSIFVFLFKYAKIVQSILLSKVWKEVKVCIKSTLIQKEWFPIEKRWNLKL